MAGGYTHSGDYFTLHFSYHLEKTSYPHAHQKAVVISAKKCDTDRPINQGQGLRIRASIFSRFIRHHEGATAIEFAMVLPVFLLFVFGIFEFGLIMHVSSLVENATHEGARYGITGSSYEDLNPDGMPRDQFIEQYIRKRVGMWVRQDEQILVTTKVVGNIVDLGRGGAVTDDDAGAGQGGQAVIYNVDYFWKIMTPFMASLIGEDGTFRIHTTVVVKNEDFCGRRHCFGE